MQPTVYPHINEVLNSILARLQGTLGEKLIGLYLFGSLVTGDYDDGCSDIDLLAATASDIDGAEFARQMHHAIVASQEMENRLEIAYLSLNALRTFKPRRARSIISPGEPFHIKEAGEIG
jgi:predicted nucleotidyltransferase